MFYVHDEPEGKFLYTETIKLSFIVLYLLQLGRVKHNGYMLQWSRVKHNGYMLQWVG